ncbi:MAG: PilW family protein [Gammaproteobacteria bacterium]
MHDVRHNDKGFSLIEVMTSLALGLVVVMLVVQLFINAKNNHAQNDRVSETLESGRYALRQLTADLKGAGFLGGVTDPSMVSKDTTLPALSTSADCGNGNQTEWAYDLTTYRSLQFDVAATSSADFTCINASDFYVPPTTQPANDILAIKRVDSTPLSTNPAAPATLTNDTVYLRSDYSRACLWYYDSGSSTSPKGSSCPAPGVTVNDWRLSVDIYYIRNYYKNAGDNIPTFCRASLGVKPGGTTPYMNNVCLAPGVERFHVMFGIDTDGDGIANEYKSAALSAYDLKNRAVSARIYVLARSLQADSAIKSNKTYTLGDETVKTTDNYYRRLYTTTVMLRNPMYAIKFQ